MTGVTLTNSFTSNKEGGVFFIENIAGPLTITGSTFSVFSSPKDGSFLHSRDPDFGFYSTNSLYECKTAPYDALP